MSQKIRCEYDSEGEEILEVSNDSDSELPSLEEFHLDEAVNSVAKASVKTAGIERRKGKHRG